MDFDNEVAEGITHLDVSSNIFHKVNFSSLACCFRNWRQFWRLLRLKVPIMVVTKTLVSVTTRLLIMLPFRHALLTACGNRYFQTILKSQLPSPSTRHGLLRSTLQSIFLTDIVLRAYKTLLLGKRFKIRSRILVAASGRSCLLIPFNICTITCTVASYMHNMISFHMCRHSCVKLVICERRGVTVTDIEPLDGASAHDPEFQMFIDRNGSHYNTSLFCHESLVSSHVPRLYHPRWLVYGVGDSYWTSCPIIPADAHTE